MVRNAFGNYRDILREASYNALMAELLTYEGSKSTSFVYEDDDKRNSNADENYARYVTPFLNRPMSYLLLKSFLIPFTYSF